MPWLSILMAVISFFTSKKSGTSTQKAALIGAAAGLGTYYVSHETEWGVKNLGELDGVTIPTETTGATETSSTGVVVPKTATTSPALGTSGWTAVTGQAADVLKSWGPAGTLGVIAGTTALTSGKSSWLWLALGAGAIILLSR